MSLLVEDIEDGVKIAELSSGSFSRTLAGSKPGLYWCIYHK